MYEQLDKLLGIREKRNMPHAKATTLRRCGETLVVRYHDTDVAQLWPNGDVRLHSGGWLTNTTKARINEILHGHFSVYADGGLWTLSRHGVTKFVNFADGMIVNLKTGTIKGAMSAHDRETHLAMRKKANAYVKAFVSKLFAGEIKVPGPGDCLVCQIQSQQSLTQKSDYYGVELVAVIPSPCEGGDDHLREHIRESYFVPSLLLAASAATLNPYWLRQIYGLFSNSPVPEPRRDLYLTREVTSALRKYLFRRLRLGQTR